MKSSLASRIATIGGMASAVVAGSTDSDAAVVSWTVNQSITPGSNTVQLNASFQPAFQINFGSSGNGPGSLGDRYLWAPNNNLSFVLRGYNDVQRLGTNQLVDATRPWYRAQDSATTSNDIQGGWLPGDNGFAGIRFLSGSDLYYGWVEMTMLANGVVHIDRWALENSPNVFVTTPGSSPVPEPATAGIFALAAGAAGLRSLRRRNRKTELQDS